jgi:hypothetical protein
MKISELLTEKEKPQAAKDLKARRLSRTANAGNTTTTAPSTTPTNTAGATRSSRIEKVNSLDKNWLDGARKRWATRQSRTERRVDIKMAKYGTVLKTFFRIIGLLGPTVQLYMDLENLDEDYKSGEDPNLQSAEDLEAARRAAWGVWNIAALASAVWLVKGGRAAFWIAKLVRWVAAGAGVASGVGAAAAVAGLLATEAAFAAFENWLQSDSGKEWILNSFLRPVVMAGGTISEGVFDSLRKLFTGSSYYAQANQGKADTAKKQGKEVPDTAYNMDANDRYVNGVLVTKPDGTIDPTAVKNPKVQNAMNRAKNAGQPSDIESLIAADPMNKDAKPRSGKAEPDAQQPAPATDRPSSSSTPSGPAFRVVY